eukprot:1196301-Prorocentrum_minimum.AAC.5
MHTSPARCLAMHAGPSLGAMMRKALPHSSVCSSATDSKKSSVRMRSTFLSLRGYEYVTLQPHASTSYSTYNTSYNARICFPPNVLANLGYYDVTLILRLGYYYYHAPVVEFALAEVATVKVDGGQDGGAVVAVALVRPIKVHEPGDAALGVLGEVGPGEAEVARHKQVVRAELLGPPETRVAPHQRQDPLLLRWVQPAGFSRLANTLGGKQIRIVYDVLYDVFYDCTTVFTIML